MAGTILTVLAVLLVALSAIAIAYVLGVHFDAGGMRDAARRFHYAIGNPVQMHSAGAHGAYASVLRHEGRRTGRPYETPVWAAATEDGFVLPIVYGPATDWLKNVMDRGSAVIVHDGRSYAVDRPEIVPLDSVRNCFPAPTRLAHRLVGVRECLRVRRCAAIASDVPVSGAQSERRNWVRLGG
jgi:hypothetical protein